MLIILQGRLLGRNLHASDGILKCGWMEQVGECVMMTQKP